MFSSILHLEKFIVLGSVECLLKEIDSALLGVQPEPEDDKENDSSLDGRKTTVNMEHVFIKTERGSFDEEYKCPNECGRAYKSQETLERHLQYLCHTQKRFNCKYCDRVFSRWTCLRMHAVQLHKSKLLKK